MGGSGDLFIADVGNNRIRMVATNGIISTVAGNGLQGYSGDGGPATSAELYEPDGVALDSEGNLLIVDSGNNRIRMVATNGIISTIAGNGVQGYSGDGGPATNAALCPAGVAADNSGNLCIADSADSRIRMVANGIISTVAGHGLQGYSGDGGPATNAELDQPDGVAVGARGRLFTADTENHIIRAVGLGEPTLLLNNVGAADAGDYTVVVSSPYGSITSATAALTVRLPIQLSASIIPASAANTTAAVELRFSGVGGANYALLCAPDFTQPTDWLPIVTNAADANGNWVFTLTNISSSPTRFFRVTVP